jgi:hypothetical protein
MSEPLHRPDPSAGRLSVIATIATVAAGVLVAAIVGVGVVGHSAAADARPALDRDHVAQIARAFSIHAEPERDPTYWEASTPVRSLILGASPSSWYALYADSSLLLTTAPQSGPTRAEARNTVRGILQRAGLDDGAWRYRTYELADRPIPCRALPGAQPCTELRVPSRFVVAVHMVNGEETTHQWAMNVGPGGTVINACGRIFGSAVTN